MGTADNTPENTAGNPEPKRPEPRTSSTTDATYRYTIGGDAGTFGGPHEPGDAVPSSVPDPKLREWLKAGVITKRAKPPRKDK